ncbi:MAG: alpha/beta fold hydrolase [Bacteriovoracaceae bacterium]|nr:alpha/beta fold hydrolase [Bacteriovoracaceae bacterium]
MIEDNYKEKLMKDVFPFYDQGQSGEFPGVDDIKIHFHSIRRGMKRAIVIIPGRTEPTRKYAEVAYDLKDKECDIYLMDHRGQGFSGRMLVDPHKGYVKNFEDYIEDFDRFLQENVLNQGYEKIFLIAHSMGGAIGLYHHILKGRTFDKIVAVAPMLEVETGSFSHTFTINFMRALNLVGLGENYVQGAGRGSVEFPFLNNEVTHSEVRFEMARDIEKKDLSLVMGGPTNNWVIEALVAGRKISKRKKKLRDVPILLLQASDDTFVRSRRQNKLCKLKNCRKIRFEGAKHEILMESDEIRENAMKEILEFLR